MRIVLAALLVMAPLAACNQAVAPAPAAASAKAAAPDAGVRRYAGSYYDDFIKQPGMQRFAPEQLGLNPAQLKRFQDAMQVETPAPLASGGGAEALVFEGCRQHDCPTAVAVLAIDAATGEVFVGVRDEQGEAVLKANDRLEALLDATSPSQHWDDPLQWNGPPPAAQ
ncbi:MAG: hypothetical protein ABUL73_04960 [Alphaproteobacteria bacterium]